MTAPQHLYDARERSEVVPFVPDGARSFLDVGCGRGGFRASLTLRYGSGIRLVGIEPVEEQAAEARDHFEKVITGTFPEAVEHLDQERFDCVLLLDVLEHMVDPWNALSRVTDLLTPTGRVVASIPSIQFLPVWLRVLRGRWDYTTEGTLDRTHLRFFTRATMIEMFEGAGFEVESIAGVTSWITPGKKIYHLRRLQALFGDTRWQQFIIVAKRPTFPANGGCVGR